MYISIVIVFLLAQTRIFLYHKLHTVEIIIFNLSLVVAGLTTRVPTIPASINHPYLEQRQRLLDRVHTWLRAD